jgi:hypothetical protein
VSRGLTTYTATRRVSQAPRIDLTVFETADGFLIGLRGRLSPARAAKVLPCHAEIHDLGDGRVAAFVHLRPERVRSLIARLEGSPCRVEFSRSPEDWAARVEA